MKNDVNKANSNNQNLDNDVGRVRKNAINVENQLNEMRKSMHQRYQNGQRKPNNQNQSKCKVEDKCGVQIQHLLWATRLSPESTNNAYQLK